MSRYTEPRKPQMGFSETKKKKKKNTSNIFTPRVGKPINTDVLGGAVTLPGGDTVTIPDMKNPGKENK